jgi:CDGSH-type Zn-finger protein
MADEVVIRCRENGPYVIQGPVRIIDHQGSEFTPPPGKPAIALCRCGRSGNRPFCDGSHRQADFLAGELASPPTETA